jgi:hypothetical protein
MCTLLTVRLVTPKVVVMPTSLPVPTIEVLLMVTLLVVTTMPGESDWMMVWPGPAPTMTTGLRAITVPVKVSPARLNTCPPSVGGASMACWMPQKVWPVFRLLTVPGVTVPTWRVFVRLPVKTLPA